MTRLAETKLAYLRERGYTQQAVVMIGHGGYCTVSNLGRVTWLKEPSELAITGAERTAKQIHDEESMPPNA